MYQLNSDNLRSNKTIDADADSVNKDIFNKGNYTDVLNSQKEEHEKLGALDQSTDKTEAEDVSPRTVATADYLP